MSGRIDHLLLESLVAGERGVLTAAHPGHLFSHVLLESLDGHNQRRNHVHCGLVAIADNVVFHVMDTLSTSTSEPPIFWISCVILVCLLPWSRCSLIKSRTRRYSFGWVSSRSTAELTRSE